MKILHTGDVHLDSPFAGADADVSEQRRSELRAAFSDMMRYARETDVDLVLIAGDLFDHQFITRETVALLRREFSALDCPVVIAPGNHDPADEKSLWKKDLLPDNVYVFPTSELTYFPFDDLGCDIYGWAFSSSVMRTCPLEGMAIDRPDRINILCAHGDASSPISPHCPLPGAVLEAFGADYCALGHIHNADASGASLPVRGGYCGCPEGRDFGETGPKGAVLIDIEKTDGVVRCETKRIRFSRRVYEVRALSVDGASTTGEIGAAIRQLIENESIGDDTLLRILLQGSVEPSLVIDTQALKEYAPEVYYLEIRDTTAPTWNAGFLAEDKGIRGEVYRALLPKLESASAKERQTGARALRLALAALAGENISE